MVEHNALRAISVFKEPSNVSYNKVESHLLPAHIDLAIRWIVPAQSKCRPLLSSSLISFMN